MMRRAFVCSITLCAGILLLAAIPAHSTEDLPRVIKAWPTALSESPSNDGVIGKLRPRGMLQLPSFKIGMLRFSQLSGLAWDDDDQILYVISDKGYLFQLKPAFENETLVGVTLLNAVLLQDLNGKPLKGRRADSEGLDILRGRNGIKGDAELLISFERVPRIVRYATDGKARGELPLPVTLTADAFRSGNEMLEAVCADPALGVLTAAERPLQDEPTGLTRLFSLSGKNWRYPMPGNASIAAMECLGDSRLLIVERDFGHIFGRNTVSLKLATLPASPSPTEPVAITEIVTLDLAAGHQIDNFEGITRHKGKRFFMVSDDNDLFVQRTLLLYFEIVE